LLLVLGFAAQLAPARGAQTPDFDRDVLPILAAACLDCHSGPEPKARLDLLSRKSAISGGRSGEAAVVPGDPEQSRLIAVVEGSDGEYRMPPRGELLSAAQSRVLREWIASGASWSEAAEAQRGQPWHWAWRAPKQVEPPAVADPAWMRHPIDRFVFAQLEAEGLAPAPAADRATLARRLSLSLTGLPPDPGEVEALLADGQNGAIERYVDALLASPHYGERLARLWLDLARYADTNGYEKDDRRSMWPWRDWVIDAFNRNLPYDRFTLEQLAGDLLEDATLDTRIASGFHRNTMSNEEGGTDPEEFRVEALHDRVHTTASVWLGATLACARCHDHKFDAFSIEDYYGFLAFFNSDRADTSVIGPSEQRAGGAMLRVAPTAQRQEYAEALAAREAALATIAKPSAELAAAQARWEIEQKSAAELWSLLTPTTMSAESGATLARGEDGSIVVSGTSSELDTYRLEFTLPMAGARVLRLELLPEPSSESRGVGRGPGGNIVLSELDAACVSADGERGGALKFARAFADHEQRGNGESWLALHAVDGNPKTGWAVAPQTGQPHQLVLESEAPFGDAPGAKLSLTLAQRYGGAHTLARFRLSCSAQADTALTAPLGSELAAILDEPAAARTPEQSEKLAAHYRAHAPALAGAREQLARADARLALVPTATTLVMESAAQPRATHVHRKGNFLDPGDEVQPRLPKIFGTLPEALPRNRLGLARWIVSPANPQFARSFVNLVWELHFGRGLVATADDFGTQGQRPSHAQLLDWLALHFASTCYDVKQLQRTILTSQTFLQSSRIDAQALERDPHNRLLARGPRQRMEAEMLRDTALCASGLLVRKLGGPSVFPPQPPGIWTMIYSSDQWSDSTGEDRYRRGLYTFARRTAPYPSFAVFDAPSREVACTRRSRTNTPLQALTTLNDPQFVEAAVALARRMLREGGGTNAGALTRGMLLCRSRPPSAEEQGTLLALYEGQLEQYRKDAPQCALLLSNGPAGADADPDPAAAAAWTIVANVLLNLDATLTLE